MSTTGTGGGGGFSTTDSTVKTVLPKPTAEEQALQRILGQLATAQLGAIQRLGLIQGEANQLVGPIFDQFASDLAVTAGATTTEERIQAAQRQLQLANRFGDALGSVLDIELQRARTGAPTQQQLDELRFQTQRGLAFGESQIDRFAEEGLKLVREELAPSRGLRPTDTPVVNAGTDVAEEAVRQKGQLLNSLLAQESQARVNLPLQNAQANLGLSSLAQNVQQFQSELQQEQFQNQLGLSTFTGNLGLGIAGSNSPAAVALDVLQQPRLAQGKTKGSSESKGFNLGIFS